jgi:hypothetical protein
MMADANRQIEERRFDVLAVSVVSVENNHDDGRFVVLAPTGAFSNH